MPKCKQYIQKFRKEWLRDDSLKDWVIEVPGDINIAHCKYCGCNVKAKYQDLKSHIKSKKHQAALLAQNITLTIPTIYNCSETENVVPVTFGETSSEQCHIFAGGAVYPNTEGRASGHNLQWTKAMISKPAPAWDATAVIDGQFKQLKLSDFLGKYLVFFFYPLDFTFVCPTEILAFNDRVEEFRKLNTEVVACSIDSHFTHLAWTKSPRKEGGLGQLKIPLLSDITHKIANDYGVYLEDQGVALRGLFIIDDKGILRQITMNDLPVGRSVDETLRLVQAFQFTDLHGEVCPAGWKPGDDTIIPNPEDSRKYFKKKANVEL